MSYKCFHKLAQTGYKPSIYYEGLCECCGCGVKKIEDGGYFTYSY
jgi:hypothetical protein